MRLTDWPTKINPYYKSKDDYKAVLADHVGKVAALQKLHDQHALLLIFQGTDAAGKDGTIRHVMSGVTAERGGAEA